MQNVKRIAHVVGPNGDVLTVADLPPAGLIRWVPRRKAELVAAVCGGLISLSEACTRYRLTPEEFSGWKRALEEGGLRGLEATRPRRREGALLPDFGTEMRDGPSFPMLEAVSG